MLNHPEPHRWRPLHGLLAIAIVGMATASGVGPGVTGVVAADASSDIPGVPLPGPVAAGRLGGAIYDVVYRLSVEPGHVIVASVSGTEGTDFDIYLFDASATTVVSTTGLLTKSAGPTSTESISWPSRLGGVYYIDLNGATDVEGDYRLTVQTVPDPTPPALTVLLADGKASTNQLAVPVTIVATEDLSGVTEMAFSPDGVAFGAWQAFAAMSIWTFSPGEGSRTLWAKVRNGVGLESAAAKDAIVMDTTPPSVIQLEPSPGAAVPSIRPVFRVTFNEPILPTSWTDLGLIVQSPTGSLVSGSYTYDAAKRLGTFVPASDMQPGVSYVINVGLVRDVAGNPVAPLASWAVTPLIPTSLDAAASPSVLQVGGIASVAVTLGGAPEPAAIDMLASEAGGAFSVISTLDVPAGRVSLQLTPTRNTTYQFRYAGAFGVAPAQVEVPVLVRRSVVLAGRNAAILARARVGAGIKLTAAIGPPAAGLSVSFRLYRFDAGRRAWVYAGSHGRNTDLAGRAIYTWTPTSPGSYYWRATIGSTTEFANNTSSVYRWSITR